MSAMPALNAPAQRGFTLVEVLVALAVVALALTAGSRAAGALADNTRRLADVMSAQWCADNALANLKLKRQLPGIGDTDFECEQLGRTLAGKLVARPTPNPNFRRVDAVVSDPDGHTLVRLTTVLSGQ
jgi:general secretion pathway protein I